MFTARTSTDLLKLRLDAEHYSPAAIANEKTIRGFGACSLYELIDVKESGYGSLPDSADYCDSTEGIPLIRGGDLSFGSIKTPEAFVPQAYQTKKCSVLSGDVLLLIKGACIDGPEGVGLVPKALSHAIFNGSCYRARCTKVDSGFLVGYSLTKIFLIQKAREIANTGISYNSEESIHGYLIPVVCERAQKYIGDKVRQAERMREFARGNINLVNLELDRFIPPYEVIPQAISRVSTQRFGTRLDCQPYRTHFLSLRDSLSKISTNVLKDIADVLPGDPVPSDEFATRGVPLVRIRDINASGFQIAETYVSEIYSKNNPSGRAHPFDIVVGMDGEFRAQMILGEELPRHINQRIGIIRATGIAPSLLAFWLNRQEGQFQLNQWSVKTTVDHTSLEYIRMVRIPRLSLEKENELANVLSCSARANYYSRVCISASKLLVEALIERKITEAELVDAQTKLEQGDDSLDRAILSRLYEEGFDATQSLPLFPDLDAYYETLGMIDASQKEANHS